MLKLNLIIALVLAAGFAHAETKSTTTKKVDKDGYQVLDMNQFKDLDPNYKQKNPRVKVTSTCKTSTGAEYEAGNAGYDACLREAEANNISPKTDGTTPPAAGFKIEQSVLKSVTAASP